MKYTKSSPIAAIRAAGQVTDGTATPNTDAQDAAFLDAYRAVQPGSDGNYTDTGQFNLQQTSNERQWHPQQPGFSMTGAQVASIINGVLGGTVTLATAQINSDRARDIAETNAATMQAIARIQADLASNPNSAQSAVLQSQLQALTAFAQQRDMFRQQETDWLKYALFGVVGLGVLGGGAYLLLRARKNPVLDAHGRPQGLKGRHYVPAAELRRKRAHRSR